MITEDDFMFNNFYEKIKNFIKKNIHNLLFFLVLYLVFIHHIGYYITTGGGIMPVGERIKVEDAYQEKGSFNLAYVSQIKGTVATYLLSYIMPNWDRVKSSDYTYDEHESVEDIEFRGNIDLMNSNRFAIKNAYREAKKSYQITDTKLYVYIVDPDSPNAFKVGDKIVQADGVDIHHADQYKEVVSKYKVGDKFKVLVKRKKKLKEIEVTLYEKDHTILSGIYISSVEEYKTDPKIKIKFKKSESGPSGGLIETLDIYNQLTKKDITKGRIIAGTGEIDDEGNILTIGGVEYKLLGAEKKKADVFLVPKGENYQTCLKMKKKKKLKIKVIGVSTFKEALEKLS